MAAAWQSAPIVDEPPRRAESQGSPAWMSAPAIDAPEASVEASMPAPDVAPERQQPAGAVGLLGVPAGSLTEMARSARASEVTGDGWGDVAAGEDFQAADIPSRHRMRQDYFREKVAPGLEGDALREAEQAFNRRTQGDLMGAGKGPGVVDYAAATPAMIAEGAAGSLAASAEGMGLIGEQMGLVEADRQVDDAIRRLELTRQNYDEAMAGTNDRFRDRVAGNYEAMLEKREKELHEAMTSWAEREPSKVASFLRDRGADLRDLAEAVGPGQEFDGVYRDVAGGVGSMLTYIGPGMLANALTRGSGAGAQMAAGLTASGALAGPAGVSDQYQRAISAGQSEEDAIAVSMRGFPGGVIQVAPLASIVKPLPAELQGKAIGQLYGILRTAGSEFAVENAGAIMQNLVEQSYNPERGTWDDTPYQGLVAGGSAAIIQAATQALTRGRGMNAPRARATDNSDPSGPQGDPAAGMALPESEAATQPAESEAWADAWREQGVENPYDIDATTIDIDGQRAEIETAAAETDTDPSPAQAEAGNYRKGRVRLHGLDIAIENPRGSTRRGTAPDGTEWESTMAHHYGDIKRTEAADGDNVDVFIGDNPASDRVFVIDQVNESGAFDEHKVMLGFDSAEAAQQGYLANYEDGWQGLGGLTETSVEQFKSWLKEGDTRQPFAAEPSAEVLESSEDPLVQLIRTPPEQLNAAQQRAREAMLAGDGYALLRDQADAASNQEAVALVDQMQVAASEGRLDDAARAYQQAAALLEGQPQGDAAAESAAPAEAAPAAESARETTYLADNTPVETQFRVMDLADLVPSNTADGRVNPAYPQALQPRDRTNANSQVQVRNIAARLNPERLGSSSDAGTGAPIIGPDGVVESGNGRTMAIATAYQQGSPQAQAYRQFVRQQAEALGLDAQAVEGMSQPVLVRERTSEIDRADFARRANEGQVAGMTAYEQALADADAMEAADLQAWAPDQSGDPLAASNRGFQRAFVSRLGNNEAARYTTRSGQAGAELGQRMQRAVFAKAFADADMVEMVTEQGDQMRNLVGALQDAAVDLAVARETGDADALAAIGAISDAVRLVRQSRQDGVPVRELVNQGDAFSGSVPTLTADLAIMINTNMRSRRALSEAMRYIGQAVRRRAETASIGDMFGDAPTNEAIANEGFRQAESGEQRAPEGDVSGSAERGESVTAEGRQADPAEGSANDQEQASAAEVADEAPLLESYTEQDVAQREQSQREAERAEADQRREEAQRAQADAEVDDFVLSGSDADADQAMARGQDALFSTRSETAEGAPQASEIEALLASAPELADTRVIQSHRDLPPQALLGMALRGVNPADVRGMFIGGDLYVIANNLESAEEGVRVAVHEAVGHKGVRGLLGDELVPVMRQIYNTLPLDPRGREALAEVLRDYPFLDRNNADHQVTIAEEMVAHLAEKGWQPSAWRRAVAKIRELLRQWFPSMRWTDADVMALAERSREFLRRQQAVADGDSDALLFSFAGERAETADLHSLQRAQESLEQGLDPEAVRQATGWFRGADGQWRFEIDDSDARFLAHRDGIVGQLWTESLDRVLDHPKLFAAYPGLRDVDVVSARGMGNERGRFVTGRREIILNAERDAMDQFSTLLHEIQHGIQHIEGFATGGNPADYRLPPMRERWLRDQVHELTRQSSERMQELMGQYQAGELTSEQVQQRIQEYADEIGLNEMRRKLREGDERGAYRHYRRLYGEAEARNVQARQHMTEAERAETAPTETQDVPDSEVIVVYNGQEMTSAPEPANAVDPGADDALFSLREGAPTADQVRGAVDALKGVGKPTVLDGAENLALSVALESTVSGVNPQEAVAFYHGDEMYVVAGNARDAAEAVRATVSTAIGRHGLRQVVGSRVDSILLDTLEQAQHNIAGREAIRAIRAEFDHLSADHHTDQMALATELVARLGERSDPPAFVRQASERLDALLQEAYPDAGFAEGDGAGLAITSRHHLLQQQRDFGEGKPPFALPFVFAAQDGPGRGSLLDLNTQVVDADGNIISDAKVDSAVRAGLKGGQGFFESATDRLRRSKSPVLVELAKRVDAYFDQAEARLGMVNGMLRDPLKKLRSLNPRQRKRNMTDFEAYMRHRDNGRQAQAGEIAERNPAVAELAEAVDAMFDRVGVINQTVKTPQGTGMRVFDSRTGAFRKIGKVKKGEFWPRAIRPEVQRVMHDPTSNTKLWHELLDALVDEGRAENRKQAAEYLRGKSGYFSSEITSDYFAGIEKARGEKLPEIFYDYRFDVVTNYARKWSDRVSQVEQFGQKLGPMAKDAFEEAASVSRDAKTRDYIGALADRVYNRRPTDAYHEGMAMANMAATGLQLGNPGTATLNIIGGTQLNVQMFGSKRMAQAYYELATEFREVYREGVELGILGKDVLNILRDADSRSAEYMDANSRTKEGLSKFAAFTMKWGGYTGTEQVIRATGMLAARAQLMDALKAWNANPYSRDARTYRAFMERNRIDVAKLIRENGKGEETAKYLRLMVNIPQGSYRVDMTPLYVDTPIGRFMFKYQKFGTQVSRLFWQQKLKPFMDVVRDPSATAMDRAQAFLPIMQWFGWAVLGGGAILTARGAMFGYLDPGPELEEIAKAFEDDDVASAWGMIANKAHANLIAGSAYGFFGNYIQMARDVADQQRVKNPFEPPGLAPIDAGVELVRRGLEQGTLHAADFEQIAERNISIYRASKRGMAALGRQAGVEADFVQLEQARRDLQYVRKAARRFADESGIDATRTATGRFGLTENTATNRKIVNALLIGNGAQAREIIREEMRNTPEEERRARLQSIRSTVRARQPVQLGGPASEEEVQLFRRWAAEKLPPSRAAMVEEVIVRYERAQHQAGLKDRR